ncbi:ER-golgi trafficking TRAPP I complex 85 kDa subunit-domain-containing protein [Gigaspora rosea]|uniref:ER-golgi trafficking TRAPP I complex 85 kDa subunit-domain-containing protein n=1 Tax=Gigaspora rosea TaxID=44941 RepID=A0A397UEI7_9GLOM|nr:ER-golgi trafficking TRAPP I complex 85 kDa subunit-domain-containing protein [Gigaspora rosea]
MDPLPKTNLPSSDQMSQRLQSPKDFVTRVLSPRIAVLSSPDADQVCQASNFPDFLTLIKPFGERIEGKVFTKDSQGAPNPIENFTVRFVNLTRLEQPDIQLTSQILANRVKFVNNSLSKDGLTPIKTKSDVTERYLEANQDELTPWYAEYRRWFFGFTGVSEHETFEHPVACILATSSSNENPIDTLRQMYNITTPAPIFEKGFMDPNILKCYVLLHDNHKAIYDEIKRTFKQDCYFLKLNSIPPALLSEDHDSFSIPASPSTIRNAEKDIWSSYVLESNVLDALFAATPPILSTSSESHSRQSSLTSLSSYSHPLSPTISALNSPTSSFTEDSTFKRENSDSQSALDLGLIGNLSPPDVLYGQYLNENDISGIYTFIRDLIDKSIIPYMEKNIWQWNEQVASSRRGITGRLFSAGRRYFNTGARTTGPAQQSSQYSYTGNSSNAASTITPEAQMRKLADYAFMLRDYRLAHSVYDTVKKDFLADKAWKYYAGAQEMIGICLLIAGNKLEIDHYFEQAVNAYLNRSKVPFYATRTTLLYYELLKHKKLYKDAPNALVRMTGEDSDLRSALFLEQAAHAFLRCSKPMVRKYAFHLMLAGHRYGKCSQREHAHRCYFDAMHVFENHSWTLIEDHIYFALGRQSVHLGDLSAALEFFIKLLRASRQPPTQQNAYLRDFMHIYKQYASKTGKYPYFDQEFPIPVIDDSSVKVILSNSQSSEYDDIWDVMEREFLEEGFTGLDIYGKPRKRPYALNGDIHRTVCAVGEPFFVQLTLHNPMQVAFNLNDLILECEYIPLPDSNENSIELEKDLDNEKTIPCNEIIDNKESQLMKFEDFDLETLKEVSLEELEKKMISLCVLPKKQGSIKILGLRYTLNSIVHGVKKFAKRGKRLNDTTEQHTSIVYAPDRSLDLLVTSPMPLLEATFHSFPDVLLSGEVKQILLEINNKGQKGLTDLRVKISHPSFFCIGDAEMIDQKVYYTSTRESKLNTEIWTTKNSIFKSSIKTIPLPSQEVNNVGSLAPGKTTLIPIWIRGDRIGKHAFRFLFTYESENNNSAMRYRCLRYLKTTQVYPSLKINAFTRPSIRGLNEFILGIEIENLQTTSEYQFQLAQLSSISPSWTISLVNESYEDISQKFLIAPRQTVFTYYRIKKNEKHSKPVSRDDVDSPSTTVTPEMFASKALELLLSGQKDLKSEPSPIDLIVTNVPFTDSIIKNSTNPLEGFSLNSRVQWRTNTLINNFPVIPASKHCALFPLYNTNDVDLSLYWNIPTLSRQGHHYIIGINLGVQQNPFLSQNITTIQSRTLFEQTVRERNALINSLLKNKNFKDESPLKLVTQCTDVYEHDFRNRSFCVVPIKISVKNCSWNRRIGYTLEMLSSDRNETSRSTLHKSVYPTVFQWTGPTSKYSILSANEEQTYIFKACFVRPGVYDVNRWRLTVNFDQTIITDNENKGEGSQEHYATSVHEGGVGMKGYVQMPNTLHLLTLVDSSTDKKNEDSLQSYIEQLQ